MTKSYKFIAYTHHLKTVPIYKLNISHSTSLCLYQLTSFRSNNFYDVAIKSPPP